MVNKKYKLTIYPALETTDLFKELFFNSKKELDAAANACADLLLFIQDDCRIMSDYSNSFIREVFIDAEWDELEDD